MSEPARRRPHLVDSNVVLDVVGADPEWLPWSLAALKQARTQGPLVIDEMVYAEVSCRFEHATDLDDVLRRGGLHRIPLPWAAGVVAGRAFVSYRRRGGARRSPLPDFYIGAHAEVMGLPLITRDPAIYRTYFPSLTVIAPD